MLLLWRWRICHQWGRKYKHKWSNDLHSSPAHGIARCITRLRLISLSPQNRHPRCWLKPSVLLLFRNWVHTRWSSTESPICGRCRILRNEKCLDENRPQHQSKLVLTAHNEQSTSSTEHKLSSLHSWIQQSNYRAQDDFTKLGASWKRSHNWLLILTWTCCEDGSITRLDRSSRRSSHVFARARLSSKPCSFWPHRLEWKCRELSINWMDAVPCCSRTK